jgi:hypothetical protein
MPYRYTNTDKWKDAWFASLRPEEKLLFIYLCDNCDCAGFIEMIVKNWSSDIGFSQKIIEGALKGLKRGLIYSKTEDCIYLRTFLKHQKNLPINPNNQAHKGIIKRFEYYKYKFEIGKIDEFIEGAQKGLERGYGNGNGICIGKEEETIFKETIEQKKEKLRNRYFVFKKEIENLIPDMNDWQKECLLFGKNGSCFLNYWTEPNKSFTKMRFELENTWLLSSRINTWMIRAEKNHKK